MAGEPVSILMQSCVTCLRWRSQAGAATHEPPVPVIALVRCHMGETHARRRWFHPGPGLSNKLVKSGHADIAKRD